MKTALLALTLGILIACDPFPDRKKGHDSDAKASTPAPLPPAVPAGGDGPGAIPAAALFKDDFVAGAAGWNEYDGTWTSSGGVYRVAGSGPIAKAVSVGVPWLLGYRYSGDLRVDDAGQASLIFSVSMPRPGTDNLRGYGAGIDTGGSVWLGRFLDGWTGLASTPAAIQPGRWYRLAVESDGRAIRVYLDGVLQLSVQDATFTAAGQVGVRGGFDNVAVFDNLAIEEIASAPDVLPPPAPAASFSEGFEANASRWSFPQVPWSVAGGRITAPAGFSSALISGGSYSDFSIEADVTPTTLEARAGLMIRGTDGGDGYYISLQASSDRMRLNLARFGGPSAHLQDVMLSGVALNQTHRLKVVCVGPWIWVYVNDLTKPVIVEADAGWSAGRAGLRVEGGVASFDNVVVTSPVTPPAKRPLRIQWSWVKGAIYVPFNAVNVVQMWQEFDPVVIERELRTARAYGLTLVQVYLNWLNWQSDKAKLLADIETFLTLAKQAGLSTTFIFFDDAGNVEPHLAPQSPPVAGVHNGQWMQCPSNPIRDVDYAMYQGQLKQFVQDVVRAHLRDPRIAFWQTYNEPVRNEGARRLVEDSYAWVKETGSALPVSATTGGFLGGYATDFYTYHMYLIEHKPYYAGEGGPEHLCTETLDRPWTTVAGVVDYFGMTNRNGFVCWELMLGRTNTRWKWSNLGVTPDEPAEPFHGLVFPDLHPWSIDDVKQLRGDDLSRAPLFTVEYFKGEFATSAKSSVVPFISFDLAPGQDTGSPEAAAGVSIGGAAYSVRWTGKIAPTTTGSYTFFADATNSARIWVNGSLLLQKLGAARSESSGTIPLTAGTLYDVKVEYVRPSGPASLHVRWQGPGVAKQLLPAKR